ncbi:MAG: hypothetical protein LC776_13595 [Acidobacteria bacterium]|nr:hypothetical protein [Acidobacteriota bacterium]
MKKAKLRHPDFPPALALQDEKVFPRGEPFFAGDDFVHSLFNLETRKPGVQQYS